MSQIDFYLLPGPAPEQQLLFACRLTLKAWRLGRQVYLYAKDATQCQTLDQLLWQFQADAFVPHQILDTQTALKAPVVISHQPAPAPCSDLLINLHDKPCPFAAQFARVAELIVNSEAARMRGREHFRHYREQGHRLTSHPISQA